ncbi:hypothetical protein ACF0H5_008845 [Mactra antiquata]
MGLWMRAHYSSIAILLILAFNTQDSHAVINDTWGNSIADDGTITWVDIPVGNKTYVTENSYSDGGLGQIFAFARSFINTVQPNEFPYGDYIF